MKSDNQDLFYHKDGFEDNRDDTYAKTEFIKNVTEKARTDK
jgi:hypothetical protein